MESERWGEGRRDGGRGRERSALRSAALLTEHMCHGDARYIRTQVSVGSVDFGAREDQSHSRRTPGPVTSTSAHWCPGSRDVRLWSVMVT